MSENIKKYPFVFVYIKKGGVGLIKNKNKLAFIEPHFPKIEKR